MGESLSLINSFWVVPFTSRFIINVQLSEYCNIAYGHVEALDLIKLSRVHSEKCN